jgi:predicted component of type VI protein secretion system
MATHVVLFWVSLRLSDRVRCMQIVQCRFLTRVPPFGRTCQNFKYTRSSRWPHLSEFCGNLSSHARVHIDTVG